MNSTAERTAADSASDQSVGELMETLLRDRDRFGSEEEFRAYAISAVRRFITDLRRLDIEIALRPNHYDRQRTLS
jgi:DNA-directed RNA polymerase specialized sigma24 family protein